ncbi:MAG: cytosine permease, partial [Terrimesophilobacter sp.]
MSENQETTPTYGSSLTRTEPFATEQIPVSERHGHPRQQFTLWFAANMVLAVMVSGFFSSLFGLSVFQGLTAVAVGTLLGAIVMGYLAGIGTKVGVPQQV